MIDRFFIDPTALSFFFYRYKKRRPFNQDLLQERQTGLEPATSTLARWRTTNCTTIAYVCAFIRTILTIHYIYGFVNSLFVFVCETFPHIHLLLSVYFSLNSFLTLNSIYYQHICILHKYNLYFPKK